MAILLTLVATVGAVSAAGAQGAAMVGSGETATVGGVSVTNASGQPANVQVADGTLDVALPSGFPLLVTGADCMPVVPAPNFARCRVATGAQITLTIGDGQPPVPAPAPAPAPPPAAAPSPFPLPPMAVPRAGTGLDAEGESLPGTMGGLGGIILALSAAATALRRRRAR